MIRLVVADDAPFIREIVRHIVAKHGIEVVAEAIDGEEAVHMTLMHRPDVVLMDIIMPKKTGIEAAKEIVAQDPSMKIIAFSTADQEAMVLQALEAGCCSFIVKPFKGAELIEVIKRSIES
jgi:two-component system chemotaxis response regulator CheY